MRTESQRREFRRLAGSINLKIPNGDHACRYCGGPTAVERVEYCAFVGQQNTEAKYVVFETCLAFACTELGYASFAKNRRCEIDRDASRPSPRAGAQRSSQASPGSG